MADDRTDLINDTVKDPSKSKLYANGFIVANSHVDIMLIGFLANDPSFVVNMPFSVAKSLQEKLQEAIESYEGVNEIKIESLNEIQRRIEKKREKNK